MASHTVHTCDIYECGSTIEFQYANRGGSGLLAYELPILKVEMRDFMDGERREVRSIVTEKLDICNECHEKMLKTGRFIQRQERMVKGAGPSLDEEYPVEVFVLMEEELKSA